MTASRPLISTAKKRTLQASRARLSRPTRVMAYFPPHPSMRLGGLVLPLDWQCLIIFHSSVLAQLNLRRSIFNRMACNNALRAFRLARLRAITATLHLFRRLVLQVACGLRLGYCARKAQSIAPQARARRGFDAGCRVVELHAGDLKGKLASWGRSSQR